jgi:hypothetical protein
MSWGVTDWQMRRHEVEQMCLSYIAVAEKAKAPKDASDTVKDCTAGTASEAPNPSSIRPGALESILKKAPVLPAGVDVPPSVPQRRQRKFGQMVCMREWL